MKYVYVFPSLYIFPLICLSGVFLLILIVLTFTGSKASVKLKAAGLFVPWFAFMGILSVIYGYYTAFVAVSMPVTKIELLGGGGDPGVYWPPVKSLLGLPFMGEALLFLLLFIVGMVWTTILFYKYGKESRERQGDEVAE